MVNLQTQKNKENFFCNKKLELKKINLGQNGANRICDKEFSLPTSDLFPPLSSKYLNDLYKLCNCMSFYSFSTNKIAQPKSVFP